MSGVVVRLKNTAIILSGKFGALDHLTMISHPSSLVPEIWTGHPADGVLGNEYGLSLEYSDMQ